MNIKMKKYKVSWTEVTECYAIIDADTKKEAIDISCYIGKDEIIKSYPDVVEDPQVEEIK